MRVFVTIFLALVVVLILGGILIKVPAVQDYFVNKQIVKILTNVPEDLFIDDALRVTICGSAAPMPVRERAATCVMVIAGGKFYIVDTGNRSSNNLSFWRIPATRLGGVMLTHYHSDHVGDLGELNMITWAQGRKKPMLVYGPTGVKQVVEGFTKAYMLDSYYRTAHHGRKYLDPFKGMMLAREIQLEGESAVVLDDGEFKVTMFLVNHAPIHPAVGYRFDYKGRSIVISGDTTKADTTIKFSKDADVLIHEALARHLVKKMEIESEKSQNKQLARLMFDIQDYHASLVEAAEVANEANVKELVLYHLVPTPPNMIAEWLFMRGVDEVRGSGVTLGFDGLTYTLPINSDEIITQDLNDRW